MSGKTLSTSTLSLRFMQNAQRAKYLKEVELEKAEVRDDAQWDVGQEVREAWGLLSEQDDESQRITHETSFLPFLFSDPADAATESDPAHKLPTGRRNFTNAVEEEKVPAEQQGPEEAPTPVPPMKDKPSRSRVHPNPIPIQAVSGKLIQGLPPLKSKSSSKQSKSARQAIFDNSGVGTDLRAAKRRMDDNMDGDVDEERASLIGFLKPSGVDAPPPPATSKSKNSEDAIDAGARDKKPKRTRETTIETDESVKKRKKKKKQAT